MKHSGEKGSNVPITVEGTYENGELKLDIPASVHRARVRAIFYEEAEGEKTLPGEVCRYERFFGTMSDDVADEMVRAIDEAFEQVDEEGWDLAFDRD